MTWVWKTWTTHDELERQAESESDADAEIESTDGNSPDVENSPSSPSETNSVVGVMVEAVVEVIVGDKAIKQPVHLQKRDGQTVAVCKFSLSQ